MFPSVNVHDHKFYGEPKTGQEREQKNIVAATLVRYRESIVTKKLDADIQIVCKGNPFLKVTASEKRL